MAKRTTFFSSGTAIQFDSQSGNTSVMQVNGYNACNGKTDKSSIQGYTATSSGPNPYA